MNDWNMIISLYQGGFRPARRALAKLGPVERCPYHNVLVMKAEDPTALLAAIEQLIEHSPALYDAISRVAPALRSFDYHSSEEFQSRAREMLVEWSPQLAGRSFHVRFHRRGARHDLKTPDVERTLDDALLEALTQAGTPGRISFTDADAVIAIDTIDDRAGVSLWTREDLARHRLLRPE